jgi:hypothetical protein
MTYRPVFQKEGPAGACVIDGQYLGWKNCTCLSFAMGIDKSTHGKVRITGCMVREEIQPRDTSGGTTIEQNAAVADLHGVHVGVHTGSGVASPYLVGLSLQSGHGVSLAGNTYPLGKGNVNHNVWLNEAMGGTPGHPTSALVYDPWSNGPQWWSWSKVFSFARALHPYGEKDPRTLSSMGISGVYCGIFPDTEGSIWGPDVPSNIRSIDPDGRVVGAAVNKAGHDYGSRVDMADLKAALQKIGHDYGSTVDPTDVQYLLKWAVAH